MADALISKSFDLAIKSYEIAKILRSKREYVFADQILRSGTSVGANIRESKHSQTKAEFARKMNIALAEAGECDYWLDLVGEVGLMEKGILMPIRSLNQELLRLLTSSLKTLRGVPSTNSY